MCGIAGILRWGGEAPAQREIERMTEAIKHRGPDGEGFMLRAPVAFGHRRLAIIDPEGGHQPMSSADESLWIIYNGELYNFRELKRELEALGHRFLTRSDTEVVLHAYDEWGPRCVERFRGMFAFGLADFRQRRLLLARDHFGIKPLYYRLGENYLAFASELPALRQVEDAPPTGSLQAVDLFLRYQYIPTPHTIYHEIFKLPPASYMTVDFDGRREEPVRYWDIEFKQEDGLSDSEWEQRAEEVIHESVNAHLVSDVPFGVFLSGGIDSSLVAAHMSSILEHPVQGFSIGFKEKDYSELAYAEEAARRCGVELHTEVVEDNALSILPDLVAHYGEPFGDSSAIPTWYVSRLARSFVPMVLSGDGGDEGFGGYSSYDYWMQTAPFLNARRVMRDAPRDGFYLLRQAIRKYLANRTSNELAHWQNSILYVSEGGRRALWRSEYRDVVGAGCAVFEEADKRARFWNRLSYAQYLDFQTYLPCDILTKVDVASMYHGLEVRTPLIDLRVVELAARLPLNQRMRRNGSKTNVRKYLLKKVTGKTFPPEFIHRKKQGFAIPRNLWFLPGQQGRRLLEEVLLDAGSPLNQCFNPQEVRAQVEAHRAEHDNSDTLWLLLVLGIWLEQNPQVSFN
jgi:asparagine synthase (glutamine-hydrolysing)